MNAAQVYFNENEPFAVEWLKLLYPSAVVDPRSIVDVEAWELVSYRRCHFFGGIAGWEYALQLAGWPADRPVWTGSCPCQPFSSAGQQKGEADKRHLWPAFRRLIAESQPSTIFGEQVASKLGRAWVAGVRVDLEALGFAVGIADLCAAGVGAPHIRQRLFWVASRLADTQGGRGRSDAGAVRGWAVEGLRGQEGQDEWRAIVGAGDAGDSGATGGLADADSGRCCQRDECGGDKGTGQPAPFGDDAGGRGSTGGLGDSDGEREGKVGGISGGSAIECERGSGRLGDAARIGDGSLQVARGDCAGETERRQRESGGPDSPGRAGPSFWSNFAVVACRDSKNRRIPPPAQSGVQPVADGIPVGLGAGRAEGYEGTFPLAAKQKNRIGLLHGAGNAIVPELAAVFVRSFMEASHQR